jgi:hypothetical protein
MFSRFRGKREDAAAEVSSSEAAAAVSPSLDLTEAPAAVPASSSARSQEFTKTFGVSPSDQLYNPYEGARRHVMPHHPAHPPCGPLGAKTLHTGSC